MKIKSLLRYFSKWDIILWSSSVTLIAVFFAVFDGENYLTLAASLIGVTSLIFIAKGNPAGQLITIAFSVLYGIISFSFGYYGEMITYLGMTAPMAVFAYVSWLRNPYNGNKKEVKVNRLKPVDIVIVLALTAIVTIAFYYILKYFNTANLIPSTFSVATSFFAACMSFRRSAYYALAYAVNDVVLIFLWGLAAMEDIAYLSVLICFVVFFANDVYAFINWSKMLKRQQLQECRT